MASNSCSSKGFVSPLTFFMACPFRKGWAAWMVLSSNNSPSSIAECSATVRCIDLVESGTFHPGTSTGSATNVVHASLVWWWEAYIRLVWLVWVRRRGHSAPRVWVKCRVSDGYHSAPHCPSQLCTSPLTCEKVLPLNIQLAFHLFYLQDSSFRTWAPNVKTPDTLCFLL